MRVDARHCYAVHHNTVALGGHESFHQERKTSVSGAGQDIGLQASTKALRAWNLTGLAAVWRGECWMELAGAYEGVAGAFKICG
jgi:hypothetical protein